MAMLPSGTTKQHNLAQLEEACTGFNRWVTGVELGRDPSDEECFWHYHANGGPENFRHRLGFEPSLQECVQG